MEETQKQKLDPRIKNVWRVSDTIALTLIFLCVFAVGGIALLVDESTSWWAGPYCLISFICFVALLILFWVVITPLRYIRWSYALSKEFLDIMRGIIVRKHTVVPFIRVQNTDTRQGPILRAFGLSSVTVDGKVKKACKLKPIPEEIQLVKTIFSVFMETGSLSKTDQYLLEHRFVTKRGKQFTRFAIRGILTNPVYMIADETAYQYLKENNVDLFAERSEFDGEHGIMAYNRTLQRPGKANQIRPMEEWIVAVGKHPGIIAGSDWVRVQAMLDVNKSKSYRRPRSNVALLSGLLRCGECGDYMRPKLTNRKNAEGELIYTYMCSTKERSHGTVCSMKNCNGNTLDAKIIEEIRKLSADKETLTRLLAQAKKVISGSKEGYDAELALLREKHAETEERIKRLVESLSVASETSAKYVMEQIDALHQESETQQMRLSELEALTEQSRMLHQEFAFHQEMIESFASAVDSATLEEKRRLLRTIVKKVVWDGKNAYVYLFAEDGEADLPPIDQPMYPLGEDSE